MIKLWGDEGEYLCELNGNWLVFVLINLLWLNVYTWFVVFELYLPYAYAYVYVIMWLLWEVFYIS
jgi:hypothetical protein